MEKIKILYIVSTLKKSGPINILYGIVKYLNKKIFDINILTLSPENVDSRENDFIKLGVNLYKINKSRLNLFINGYNVILNEINKINPDIIHSHGFRPDSYVSKYKKCITINTIHNYPHKDYVMRYGCLLGKYMYKKQLRYIKNINCPIACSQSISIELKNKFKIETLYIQNGVSIKSSCKNKKNELRNKLNIPINKKVLISVGALIERKNPKFLIECFLNSNIKKDAILLLLGDGNLKNSLEKISNENIIFAGNVDNVNEYLTLSDIFISASKAEGLPNAVMEAMSNELPVILSNINPHSEIIKNSNCGLLFNLEKEELINCLNKIDKLDIKGMGKNSRLIIEENFTDKKMSKSYEELYINLFMNDKR
ncbi:glycosyltransferase family 4 protein [Clostridium perfringens]|uniref:glycosyltransferase family 4 protein n=2 Tax=Clostridium perfringens TaxID=1502 RepID=UPI001D4BB87D|nr:glycosyltransferase family 4 protein [Clostridium perfringens]EHK2338418.1 glycosyltransferase family 4 protein [Clostridium perfringens]EJT6478056.1 glycosyltransferase family 4 protein [Clostridium perfringens]ELC8463465.1 glycosyltransferase family 4 protein [Clostridium perfringens]MCC5422184.1 glycosyltransferase family 4 protein [Clostridium perfringens]MDZ4970332.1 glycosyltransferase [Clostridium perfringens]